MPGTAGNKQSMENVQIMSNGGAWTAPLINWTPVDTFPTHFDQDQLFFYGGTVFDTWDKCS